MIVAAKLLFDTFLWSRRSEINSAWMEAAFCATQENRERAEINADSCEPPDGYRNRGNRTWYHCKLYNAQFWIGVGVDNIILCVG